MREQLIAPSGLWVVFAPKIGVPGWYVRVYNFATWHHRTYEFDSEAKARTEFMRWTL